MTALAQSEPPALSIRVRVRRIQDETGSVDPREIAGKLVAELSDADLRDALAESLPEYVRQVMKGGRNSARVLPPARSTSPRNAAAAQRWFETLLTQPVDVSGGQGQWKALRDCTREDLLVVARHRRELAAKNSAIANRYEALAKVLPAGATVASLPEDTVVNVFGREAA